MTSFALRKMTREELENDVKVKNLAIEGCKTVIERVTGLVYNKDTKVEIQSIVDFYCTFGLYNHFIKKSLKRNLVADLIKYATRQIADTHAMILTREALIAEKLDQEAVSQKKADAREITKRMYEFEDSFVRSFDSVREGQEQFGSLIYLIEDLTITEAQLPEYGFYFDHDAY